MTARRTRITTGAVVAACLLVAACSSAADNGDGDISDLGDADPGDCATIDMAVSSEKIALLTELANDFNGSDAAELTDGCAFVRPYAISGRRPRCWPRSWPDPEVNGVRPVIWSPAASAGAPS